MKFSTASTALNVAKKAYGGYAEYRNRKAREAYDTLVEAANHYDVPGLIDDSTQRLNTLSEKALKRFDEVKSDINLDKATEVASEKIAEFSDRAQEKTARFKKAQAKKAKAAEKAAKKAARKARRRRGCKKLRTVTVVTAILAAIGAVVYFVLGGGKNKKVDTQPPATADYDDTEAAVVYSTTTGDDAASDTDHEAVPEADDTSISDEEEEEIEREELEEQIADFDNESNSIAETEVPYFESHSKHTKEDKEDDK